MPTLKKVCVWTLPISPDPIVIYDFFSPNIVYTMDCTSGMENNQFSGTRIYPTPADREINITSLPDGNYIVKLADLTGRLIISGKHYIRGRYALDVSNVTNGIYILDLQNNTGELERKVIVQH